MIKNIFKIFLATSLLIATALAEDTNTTKSNWSGEIRGGYQYEKNSVDKENEYSIGGSIKYESDSWNNLNFAVALQTTNGNGTLDKLDYLEVPFFDFDNNNYTILNELYIKGIFSNSEIIVGRQAIETPFVDSDDKAMIPNRFEAITITNKDIINTTINAGYIKSWAGVDSPNPKDFTNINNDDGLYYLGATYEGIENLTTSLWYYNAPDFLNIGYIDGVYTLKTEDFESELGLQYALQDYKTANNTKILGVMASTLHKPSGIGLKLSYNNVKGDMADNFYGGGPMFTNTEFFTIVETGDDSDLYNATLSYEIPFVDGLAISGTYFDMKRKNLADAKEMDIVGEYEYDDNLSFLVAYADMKDENIVNHKSKNLRMFAKYKF
jgi:imipenem/basic amino acid-specific outer membrane pore